MLQGRAGLVALRRYRGGTNALGKAFYKGGFEKTMNRREAALILETPYVHHLKSFNINLKKDMTQIGGLC